MRWALICGSLMLACGGDGGDGTSTGASESVGESESAGESESESAGESESGSAGETETQLEGTWRATPGMALGGSCEGNQAAVLPGSDYRIEARAGGIDLYYVQSDTPIHSCDKEGGQYVCPSVMLGGTSCEQWDLGLRIEFVGSDDATGEATYRFDCFNPDPNIPCCTGYGDVNPCTRIFAWTMTRVGT